MSRYFHRGMVGSLLLATLVLMVELPAIGDTQQTSSPRIKVGMLLTLSGSFAQAGEDCRRGIEAAIGVSPQSLIVPIFVDSKNESKTAVSEFRKLVDVDKALAIYTHRSNMGMAINPLSKSLQVPTLGAVGHKDFASNNEYAFQVWPKSDEEGAFLADELLRRGYKKAALLFTEDDWMISVSDGFRNRFTSGGGLVVFDQSFLPSEQDFRPLLLRAKAQSPDAIFMNVILPQIPMLIKQVREFGVPGSRFANFYAGNREVLDALGTDALEGVRFAELDTDLPTLKSKLGVSREQALSGLTVVSYLSTLLLVQAAAQMPNIHTSAELYKALLQQRELRTPDRNFVIQDRLVKLPMVMKRIHEGMSVVDLRGE